MVCRAGRKPSTEQWTEHGRGRSWQSCPMTSGQQQAKPPTATTAADSERWLTRGVGGIGLASLLADIGHEVPTALLPSLLTTTMGVPAAALGLIEGIADACAGVARFGGGALADDPERRPPRLAC